MFNYWGFGFNISSEIEFPELAEADSKESKLTIKLGTTPTTIGGQVSGNKTFMLEIAEHELLFTVNNIAKYHAKNGNEITVEVLNASNESRTIRLYILATVMASILLQKGMIPLHASAVKVGNRLTLIAGHSGAGKSTLLAEMLKKGYPIFSDDVVVLSANNLAHATASYPMIKLWEDSISMLGDTQFEAKDFRIRYDLNKYGYFFHKSFDKKSYPVDTIVILRKGSGNLFEVNQLEGVNAFVELNKQLYRPALIQSKTHKANSFNVISELARHARTIEVVRPLACTPSQLLELIEKELATCNTTA